MTENIQTCPCGSGSLSSDCCEPIVNGSRKSETAEELMRARYSAFVTGAIDFIVNSTHSHTKQEIDLDFIRQWSQNSEWQGLQIFETKQANDDKAFVSFAAQYTQNGKDYTHRE